MFDRNLFGEDVKPEAQGSGLSQTWEYPPFSVLSARDGWWQERKRQWLALGIQSELGRGDSGVNTPNVPGGGVEFSGCTGVTRSGAESRS